MVKRLFDILFSSLALILLSPVFTICCLLVLVNSGQPVLFRQIRAGKNNTDFILLKFRTMHLKSEVKGSITVGMRDPRITSVGYYLRKFKLDELPQLLNVLKGDMSIVGPRPEVRKYVSMYSPEQLHVLNVRPGITDYASIRFHNENEILARSEHPEEEYINRIMPEKLSLNLKYIEEMNLITDLKIILQTAAAVFFPR